MLLFLHNNKSHILNVSRTELVLVSLLIEWVLCFVATSEMSSFKINVVVLSVFMQTEICRAPQRTLCNVLSAFREFFA